MARLELPINERRSLRLIAPITPNQLHAYVRAVLGFHMPRLPLAPGHSAPFDYIQHAFFEESQPRDCIVWANRGGGKTQIGAIATLLDLLFKPGIEVRILGGSFEQSSKMHRYLKRMLESDVFNDLIAGQFTERHVELTNGSRVEVLSQSERAVRGQRVHKLRCDEVELFDRDVWEAAQLVTRSGRCGNTQVHAAVEALSTMHRPFGLMQKLVHEQASGEHGPARRLFRWSVLDTLAHCEPSRRCDRCALWSDCGGIAKTAPARGFVSIDDAIQQKRRVGEHTWQAEALCNRPNRSDAVYPQFDPEAHVFDDAERLSGGAGGGTFIAGIDFGYRDLAVMLFAMLGDDGVLRVFDEIAERHATAEQMMSLAAAKCESHRLARPLWIGADPAGYQRSDQTGVGTITLWRRAGWNLRAGPSRLEAGVNAVRRRLKRGDGFIGLRLHRRCATIIRAMQEYHYPPDRPDAAVPMKDGPDHACDALRYMIVNLDSKGSECKVAAY